MNDRLSELQIPISEPLIAILAFCIRPPLAVGFWKAVIKRIFGKLRVCYSVSKIQNRRIAESQNHRIAESQNRRIAESSVQNQQSGVLKSSLVRAKSAVRRTGLGLWTLDFPLKRKKMAVGAPVSKVRSPECGGGGGGPRSLGTQKRPSVGVQNPKSRIQSAARDIAVRACQMISGWEI